MLDNETKRRIDTCRDILVGKVPDPKSQVEQITIGLIYKFMDDMDAEAEELGGLPSFFVGEYDRFGWRKIFNPALGGHEMLSLYSEAITRLALNPNLPQLFRDIFKNAYLPYRDPETLKSFLKEIDWFSYDHSEKLGDAFEYLLSVLGSQGDAGQFRTPRHIIDFIVALLDPKKNETIMDPACGTAGFLISAYKHILAKNSVGGESKLTPDERTRLTANIKGYDISPDMVRLSLVNLYLHGFAEPHIFEYDSLTSEDRWNEYADVFLANPPFMSPKGGIKPHKRFSVESNRSEVLFVDYMVEHLTPNGRAAIIVPEGIIFQSGTAYKALRKMLVDNQYLVGVISLPAGVFQPYSGVKTSILWIDRTIAKRTDKILFAKIEADGFDLGAQRKASKKNDLPDLLESLKEYIVAVGNMQETDLKTLNPNISLVRKEAIGRNGDYSLSGERYSIEQKGLSQFPLIELKEITKLITDGTHQTPDYVDEGVPFLRVTDITLSNLSKKFITEREHQELIKRCKPERGDVLYSKNGTIGIAKVVDWDYEFSIFVSLALIKPKAEEILSKYLEVILNSEDALIRAKGSSKSGTITNLHLIEIKNLQIPLPPLSIQAEIVAEIEGYQKIIDGARQVVENYKPRIDIDPEWEMVELGEVCEINPRKSEINISGDTLVSFVPMSDINENQIGFQPKQVKPVSEVLSGYTYFKDNDVLIAKVTPCFENGKAGIAKELVSGIGFGSSEYYVIRPNPKILSVWIFLNVTSEKFRQDGKNRMTGTGGLQRVPREFVSSYMIPLPTIELQQQIVIQIEKQQSLVNANRELISIFEQKIKDRIAKVWGATQGMVNAISTEPFETISIAAETATIYNI